MPRTREKESEPSRGTSKAALRRLAGRIQPDALFRAVLDSAPDAIAVIDGGGRIVLANAQTARLFGYSVGSDLRYIYLNGAFAEMSGMTRGSKGRMSS